MVHPWAAVILFPWCLESYTFGSLFTQVEDDSSMPWLLTKTLHWLRPLFAPEWNYCYLWHFVVHQRMVLGFAGYPSFWTAIKEHQAGIHEFLPLLKHYVYGAMLCSFQSGYYFYLWPFIVYHRRVVGRVLLFSACVLDSKAEAS